MGAQVADALLRARASGIDRLDAQCLLAHTLGRTRAWVLAHDDAGLAPEQLAEFAAACRRRADGEPLAYLVGEREFHGLQLRVTPAVLVPRADTETLVDWALELLRGPLASEHAPEVADLGTGSGAIALAIKHAWPAAQVCAVDRSASALDVARGNGARLGLDVSWRLGDWWQPLDGRRLHLAVSNPPYVAPGDPHLHALRHEPPAALVPPGHALAAIEAIAAGAASHLRPTGWLLLEHGVDQAEAVQRCLRGAGLHDVQTRCDLEDRPRCTGGRLPATRDS